MLRRIKQLDTNKDGKIQASEVPARYRALTNGLDKDGDGQLDAAELSNLNFSRVERLLRGGGGQP